MAIYLIRHGEAGQRKRWKDPDELRPLNDRGRAQAEGLMAQLLDRHVGRVLSSRYTRCIEMMQPLAAERGLEVELVDALAEEGDGAEVIRLLVEIDGTDVALCTHGNVLPLILGHLRHQGVPFDDDPNRCQKGSTWVIDGKGASRRASYLPPPA